MISLFNRLFSPSSPSSFSRKSLLFSIPLNYLACSAYSLSRLHAVHSHAHRASRSRHYRRLCRLVPATCSSTLFSPVDGALHTPPKALTSKPHHLISHRQCRSQHLRLHLPADLGQRFTARIFTTSPLCYCREASRSIHDLVVVHTSTFVHVATPPQLWAISPIPSASALRTC